MSGIYINNGNNSIKRRCKKKFSKQDLALSKKINDEIFSETNYDLFLACHIILCIALCHENSARYNIRNITKHEFLVREFFYILQNINIDKKIDDQNLEININLQKYKRGSGDLFNHVLLELYDSAMNQGFIRTILMQPPCFRVSSQIRFIAEESALCESKKDIEKFSFDILLNSCLFTNGSILNAIFLSRAVASCSIIISLSWYAILAATIAASKLGLLPNSYSPIILLKEHDESYNMKNTFHDLVYNLSILFCHIWVVAYKLYPYNIFENNVELKQKYIEIFKDILEINIIDKKNKKKLNNKTKNFQSDSNILDVRNPMPTRHNKISANKESQLKLESDFDKIKDKFEEFFNTSTKLGLISLLREINKKYKKLSKLDRINFQSFLLSKRKRIYKRLNNIKKDMVLSKRDLNKIKLIMSDFFAIYELIIIQKITRGFLVRSKKNPNELLAIAKKKIINFILLYKDNFKKQISTRLNILAVLIQKNYRGYISRKISIEQNLSDNDVEIINMGKYQLEVISPTSSFSAMSAVSDVSSGGSSLSRFSNNSSPILSPDFEYSAVKASLHRVYKFLADHSPLLKDYSFDISCDDVILNKLLLLFVSKEFYKKTNNNNFEVFSNPQFCNNIDFSLIETISKHGFWAHKDDYYNILLSLKMHCLPSVLGDEILSDFVYKILKVIPNLDKKLLKSRNKYACFNTSDWFYSYSPTEKKEIFEKLYSDFISAVSLAINLKFDILDISVYLKLYELIKFCTDSDIRPAGLGEYFKNIMLIGHNKYEASDFNSKSFMNHAAKTLKDHSCEYIDTDKKRAKLCGVFRKIAVNLRSKICSDIKQDRSRLKEFSDAKLQAA